MAGKLCDESITSTGNHENVVLAINFSATQTNLKDFKQELPCHAYTPVISNKEVIMLKLDNKYYTADIKILIYENIDANTELDKILGIIPNSQAIVIIIDDNINSWALLQEIWDKLSAESNAEIQLALVYGDIEVSNSDNPNFIWCIKHHFEYIPMIEQKVPEDDENYFKEKFGIPRMIEALQTHVWDNLEMKDKSPRKPIITDTTNEHNRNEKFDLKSEDKIDSLLDGMTIENKLNGADDDDDEESFEKLFGSIMEMRKKAAGLEGEERLDYAEKMVNLFMNAIPNSDDD
ncbi:Alpha- and gamma-adaptin-binding protein p34 [Oopsacas minuta]|uniref:Alpha- and gamma-adaptin-binding protein p34 n=1 Tax=Oopsacas minuta TaxID=111878 RepID=A0AAV7JUK3_9METZ|nr:Alpha- and gamma-adaptin-binding protein p34 [Oopsacas minuta]